MQNAVTLQDVAKAAKVSKTTASNVFSRPERVRAELRERVESAAAMLGYDGPDPKGRMLSSGRVNAIGVAPFGAFGITLFFKNEYQRAFLAGIAEVCEERGVGLSLVSARDDQQACGIKNALVDGFILDSKQISLIEPALRRRLPVVVMDAGAGPEISSVTIENRDGTRQVTRHLLALGHRRFVIGSVLSAFQRPIFHPPTKTKRRLLVTNPGMLERIAGVGEALAEAGLSLDEVPIVEACGTPEEEEAFGNGAAMLLDKAPEATAVIALTDSLALNVLEQAKKRGLSVPRDLSVVGFDDIADAALSDPPLTTIAQSASENGRVAARILLDGGPPRHLVLPIALIVRASTAPPRE